MEMRKIFDKICIFSSKGIAEGAIPEKKKCKFCEKILIYKEINPKFRLIPSAINNL
jgi:hypothetical protein